MRSRRLALLAPLALAATLWAPQFAAGAQGHAVTTLEVAIPGPFAGCDPGSTATTPSTDAVLSLVLPSAFTAGLLDAPTGDTFAIASAEVVDPSPQTVVYTITAGETWANGAPFTAADLVRTWQERRDDKVVADLGYRDIAYMHPSATGESVTVGFTHPYTDWESLFSLVVPTATSGAHCAVPSATYDPSIGPYSIASASTSEITLTANPAWTGATLAYGRVVVTADPTVATAATSALRIVDLPDATLPAIQAISSTGTLDAKVAPSSTIVSLDFAVVGHDAVPVDVRAALAELVDRDQILDATVGEVDYTGTVAASHLFGPGQVGFSGAIGAPIGLTPPAVTPSSVLTGAGPAAYGDTSSPATATEELHAAGYTRPHGEWLGPSGRALEVCLAVPADAASMVAVAQDIEADLDTQGVAVTSTTVGTDGAVAAALRSGACTMGLTEVVGDGFVTHEAARWTPPTPPVPAGLAWTGLDDPLVDADSLAASETLNPVAATTSWTTMDDQLWDLMVSLPLYSPPSLEAWSPAVTGVQPCSSVQQFVDQVPELLLASPKS